MNDKFAAAQLLGSTLVNLNGLTLSTWPEDAKTLLQEARDLFQPEHDFVFDRGSWQVVLSDYFYDLDRRSGLR